MEPTLTLGNALGFAVQLSLKATAVLVVTALIVLALRRSSAASRHLAASLGLLAVAVLPLAALVLPRWELPVLPRVRLPAAFSRGEPTPGPRAADLPQARIAAGPGAFAFAFAVPAPPAPPLPPAPPFAAVPERAEVAASAVPSLVMSGPWLARSTGSLLSRLRVLPLTLALLAVIAAAAVMWATGALALLARLAVSAFKVRRTVRAALPAGAELESMVPEASAAVGLTRKATLLVAADQPVAMTAGSLQPVVLLPEAAYDWTRARTKVVLLHELAHVARSDWEWLLVSEIALAFFWFHPLVWWLHRSVRRDAEQAADDRVLAAGTRPSDYASHLIALVRSLRGDGAPRVSMAMASSSGIESRLRSILDAQKARSGPGRTGRLVSMAAACGALLLLAAAAPTSAASEEPGLASFPRHAPRRTTLDPRQRLASAEAAREEAEAQIEAARERAEAQAEAAREQVEAQAEAERDRLEAQAEAEQERLAALSDAHGRRTAEMEQRRAELEQRRAELEQRQAQVEQRVAEIEERRAEIERSAAEAQRALAMADQGRRGDFNVRLRGLEGLGDRVGSELGRAFDEAFSPKVQAKVQRELDRAMGKLADRRSWSSSTSGSRGGDRDWYSRGMELHRKEKYPQAIEAFQKAIEADQRADDASYNIACGYARLGDVPKAIDWLKKAQDEGFDVAGSIDHDDDFDDVRDDAKFRDARKELRKSRGQGEAKAALRKLERVEARKPKEPGPWDQAGRALLDAGEYDAAAKAFNAAAERAPGKSSYLYNAACALSQKGDKKAALDELEQAIAAGFDDVSHMKQDDDLADVRGEPRFKELVVMARALEFPGNLRSFQWGPFKRTRGDKDDELARLEDAVKKYEKVGRAWHNLGYGLLAVGKYAEAEKAFAQALSRGYQPGKTLYNLGCAAALQEHKDAALDFLKRSVDAGFSDWEQMKSDEDLDSLHGDARFKALVRASRELSYKEEDEE